jgi:hypothetical protein
VGGKGGHVTPFCSKENSPSCISVLLYREMKKRGGKMRLLLPYAGANLVAMANHE